MTLLQMPSSAAACVLELGMSHLGEIALLADICQPTVQSLSTDALAVATVQCLLAEVGREVRVPQVRVITNIGAAHTAGVGGIEGVARAKGHVPLGPLERDSSG